MKNNFFINQINYNNLGYNTYEYLYKSNLLSLNKDSINNIYILSNGYFPSKIVKIRNKNGLNDYIEIVKKDIDDQFYCAENRIKNSKKIIYFYPYEAYDYQNNHFILDYLKSKTNKEIKMIVNNNKIKDNNYLHFNLFRYDCFSNKKKYTITNDFKKKFLFLNNKRNDLREKIFSLLFNDDNIRSNSYYSFLFKGITLDQKKFNKNFIDISKGETDFYTTHANFLQDDFLSNKIRYYFENIFLYVITENSYDLNFNYLTEKTYKSFYQGVPFLLISSPHSLEYLKSIGFKTFSKWINEDYDKELNLEKRIKIIFNEIYRINNLKKNELIKTKKDMRDTLEYNQYIYFNNFKNEFISFFNDL